MTGEEAAELMLVTEGRDGTLLLELLDNDELPPAFQLEGEVRRHLVVTTRLQPAGDSWRSLLEHPCQRR